MYGSSYMFRHYIARVVSNDVLRVDHIHPQYSIDCSSIEHLTESSINAPEDGNVMPKHVGATIHN
jgi:hypothetical protein